MQRTAEEYYAADVLAASTDEPTGWTKLQTIIVVLVGVAFSAGVLLELGPLNGIPEMSKWEWPWRHLGVIKTALAFLAPFLAICWVVRRSEKNAARLRVWLLLTVLVLSNFGLQVGGVLADPRGFGLFEKIVASPKATSYYTDALAIGSVPQFLSAFHQLKLHNHASTHPPGPILFYYVFVQLFGPSAGALIGGCAVGLAGSLGILVLYRFAGLWTRDERTRILASAFYALLPALVVFFPEFDQSYPILAMLMIILWAKALAPSARHACYLGAILFVTFFFVYNLVAAGAFLAFYAMYWLWRERGRTSAYVTLLTASTLAWSVCVGLYVALWGVTGYNPIAAFRHALVTQAKIADYLGRSYLRCAIYDPYDFAMGAGVIAVVIVLFYLKNNLYPLQAKRTEVVLTVIGLATIFAVDWSGLLRAETARVWLFLQPLLAVPVALELSRLRGRWLLAIFVLQWWILVCLKAKMSFILP